MTFKHNAEYIILSEKRGIVIVTLVPFGGLYSYAILECQNDKIAKYSQDSLRKYLGEWDIVGEL
jgi:hypothetical protein